MKTLALLLLSLLTCSAQMGLRDPGWVAAVTKPASGAACATTETTNAYDNLLEGFQDAADGYDNTWTEVAAGTSVITAGADSSALSNNKPPGACSKAWKIVNGADGVETYAYTDAGAVDLDTVQTDVYFSLYVEAGPNANGESYIIFEYRSSTSPIGAAAVSLRNTSGQLNLLWASTGGDPINISSGQWYSIKLTLDTAAAADGSKIEVWSGGSLIGSDLFTRSGGDLRYVFIGTPSALGTADDGTLWFDLVTVKTN